jgi:hypothetical protein
MKKIVVCAALLTVCFVMTRLTFAQESQQVNGNDSQMGNQAETQGNADEVYVPVNSQSNSDETMMPFVPQDNSDNAVPETHN